MEERPIECSKCKKEGVIIYNEIVGSCVSTWKMCRDCPMLHLKLRGGEADVKGSEKGKNVCCSTCHTSLESILMGGCVGCKECYQVFQDILIKQLIETDQLSSHLKLKPTNQASMLHIGRAPHIDHTTFYSMRMSDLNEALGEALKKENYEEAAWLRDQINVLMEKSDGKI